MCYQLRNWWLFEHTSSLTTVILETPLCRESLGTTDATKQHDVGLDVLEMIGCHRLIIILISFETRHKQKA